MYYIEQDNKIVFYNNTLEDLNYCLASLPQYDGLPIQEVPEGYTIVDFQLMTIEEAEGIELAKAKKIRIRENDTIRDEAINGGVTYKNILFDSDTDQKINLLAMVSTMSDDDLITWFGKDNQPLDCTKEDLLNIGGLITQLHSFCWNKNAQIKTLIDIAESLEDLEKIEIDYTESAEVL